MTNYQRRTATANYERYSNMYHTDLNDCYNNYSDAKARAWEYCKGLCNKYNGYGLSIISYNTFMFTAGFTYYDADNKKHFVFITPSYDADIIVGIN